MIEDLAQIGREMVSSDNRATACPVWFSVESFPRFFLSEPAATKYANETGKQINVASAHDNEHIKMLMRICLETAGEQYSEQARNAYSKRRCKMAIPIIKEIANGFFIKEKTCIIGAVTSIQSQQVQQKLGGVGRLDTYVVQVITTHGTVIWKTDRKDEAEKLCAAIGLEGYADEKK